MHEYPCLYMKITALNKRSKQCVKSGIIMHLTAFIAICSSLESDAMLSCMIYHQMALMSHELFATC